MHTHFFSIEKLDIFLCALITRKFLMQKEHAIHDCPHRDAYIMYLRILEDKKLTQ